MPRPPLHIPDSSSVAESLQSPPTSRASPSVGLLSFGTVVCIAAVLPAALTLTATRASAAEVKEDLLFTL